MAKRRGKKSPTTAQTVNARKRPRSVPVTGERQVRVSFAMFDAACTWCNTLGKESEFPAVASKIKSYESMKWTGIESGGRDHPVLVGRLISAAQERLTELKLDDLDELWRFRFGGRERLWGIRVGDCFYALWWDPTHAVCPSKLRHT